MILDNRDFSEKPVTSTLLISVEDTVSNVNIFFQAIQSIKRRFGFNISIVFKRPELLFFNKRMLLAASNAEIDRILITDNTDLIWLDLMEFAKRQETDYVIFTEAESLVSNWSGILKFITSSLYSDFKFKQSNDAAFFACRQSHLRTLISDKFESYKDLKQSVAQGRTQRQHTRTLPAGNFSLFTSKTGLKRFGGLDKFKEINKFVFDGKKISEAKKIWQIDNQMDLLDFFSQDVNRLLENELITIPGILTKTDSHQIILDINPGCGINLDGNEQGKLQIPRMLLTISIVKEATIKATDIPATFIMSNFNKGPYIASTLYSIALQTHQNIRVEIIDDISTDHSIAAIKEFSSLVDKNRMPISFSVNEKSKGTYWIRNSIIQKFIDSNHIYFINDSDDFSSSQRVTIQLAIKEASSDSAQIYFGDIVRVDSQFTILPLDGKVERYGTASLGAPMSIHKKYGYYENIKKNADTEFIERLRYFSGKSATKWFRYPILFQPFDGGNLTSDIYQKASNGSLTQTLNKRARHGELFRKKHTSLKLEELSHFYSHPNFNFDDEYKIELADFLVTQN